MEIGTLLIIYFVGWYVLPLIPNEFETHNNKKGNMWTFIIGAWIFGGALLILIVAGIFG